MSKNQCLPVSSLLSPVYLWWTLWCIPPSVVAWFLVPDAFEYVWNQTAWQSVVASLKASGIFAVWGVLTFCGLRLAERLKWI
jgi:hypothetical protein